MAPDQDVFREVPADSGVYVDANDFGQALAIITVACTGSRCHQRQTKASIADLQRWNSLAAGDHRQVLLFLRGMLIC